MSFVMRSNLNKSLLCLLSVLAVASVCSAQGQYAVMLQQTPQNGGSINPGTGVHSIAANAPMAVTAVPKPGYQFVYWLGDVADPTSATTVVSVNSPKIVVAVFERSEYEKLNQEEASPAESMGGGGDSLIRNSASISGPSGISPASGGDVSYGGVSYNITNPTDDGDDNGDAPPVPDVPEPATMLLFGLGSLLTLKKRK